MKGRLSLRNATAAAVLVWLAAILAIVGYQVRAKEKTIAGGTRVLLRLAPVDPRSIMQGDYMTLRYALAIEIENELRQRRAEGSVPRKGTFVLRKNQEDRWTLVRLYRADGPPAADELLLQYRYRGDRVDLGAESFFFPEGQAKLFDAARYGELRVDASGKSVLIGLRDEAGRVLGQPIHE